MDWGPEIDIAGFVFLDLASSFKPPETLDEFLKAGEPPVYIGFGSIVVDDPDKFTKLIFEAVSKAGVRALVSKGWGGLGDEGNTPDNIYMLENTPHDWLFPRVSAVVHHGGAGTTAIGLKCGKPTMIVPFFGDQPFWGSMVAKAGAGAREPIPYKKLSADALAEGIRQCLLPESRAAAEKLAHDIDIEGDGASNAVDSFHNHLQMRGEHSMRCSILQDRVAVWELKKKSALRLSALAAEILVVRKKIRWHELRLLRHRDWNDFEGPGEPFTGGGAALLGSAGSIAMGIGGVPIRWAKSLKKRRMGTQRKEHRKRSQAKTTSSESKKASSTKQNNKPVENGGELSHGGQHGIEKHLPEAQPPGNAVSFENYQNPANGGAVGPIPGHVTDRDEDETMYSDATEDSQDNIAQDIAQGTRTGLVKSGEALAKGIPSRMCFFSRPTNPTSIHSPHGSRSSPRSRLSQCPPALWRLNRSYSHPNLRHSIRAARCWRRIHIWYLRWRYRARSATLPRRPRAWSPRLRSWHRQRLRRLHP